MATVQVFFDPSVFMRHGLFERSGFVGALDFALRYLMVVSSLISDLRAMGLTCRLYFEDPLDLASFQDPALYPRG